eukprot:gene30545-36916_t
MTCDLSSLHEQASSLSRIRPIQRYLSSPLIDQETTSHHYDHAHLSLFAAYTRESNSLNGKERIEVWKQCLKSNALSSDSHIRGYVKPSVNYSSNPEYLSFHEVKALYDSLSESLDFSMYTKYSSGQEGEVMRDVVRTYQAHPLFNGDGSPGIRVLSRVLLVYIRARPSVGYCQGMNFILGAMFICWVGGGDDGDDDGEGGTPPPNAAAVPALTEEELQSVQYSLFEM